MESAPFITVEPKGQCNVQRSELLVAAVVTGGKGGPKGLGHVDVL
jgi:hypothetical protein